jgi:mannose-6-phosphate isomerase
MTGEREAIELFRKAPGILPLEGAVQHYAWGGFHFIPSLLGVDNSGRIPYAELWIGAHPFAPSSAMVGGGTVPLDKLIEAAPTEVLGARDSARFKGRLPFLMKVLDARVMLSIQAHPNRRQAAEGFARENVAGIPLDSPGRTYKDENHKPETHVALSEFWMLHGFRPLEDIGKVLAAVPELGRVMPGFRSGLRAAGKRQAARERLLQDLYATVMTMPQETVDNILFPLIGKLSELDRAGALDRDDPGFWALRAARELPLAEGHIDRGIFSIYLLNLLHLRPGEGTYQPAGTLHAYLEGTNVELMASSDNVLRGGLTPKSVHTEELLRIVSYADGRPRILVGQDKGHGALCYETPAEEFALERIELNAADRLRTVEEHGAECLIVLEGSADVVARGSMLRLDRGKAALFPGGVAYELATGAQDAVVFRARIPDLGE